MPNCLEWLKHGQLLCTTISESLATQVEVIEFTPLPRSCRHRLIPMARPKQTLVTPSRHDREVMNSLFTSKQVAMNTLLGTWKLKSLVWTVTATGEKVDHMG
jgi:predicted nucleotidyltransferase